MSFGFPVQMMASGSLPAGIIQYDAADISTLFQDTAGTVPVTAAGQSVQRINDRSGSGNNLIKNGADPVPTYEIASGKPVLRNALNNSALWRLNNFVGAAGAEQIAWFGALSFAAISNEVFFNIYDGSSVTSFFGSQMSTAEGNWDVDVRDGGLGGSYDFDSTGITTGVPYVVSCIFDGTLPNDEKLRLRVNGIDLPPDGAPHNVTPTKIDMNADTLVLLNTGFASTGDFQGDYYGGRFVIGPVTAAQISALEQFYASMAGITL